MGLQAVGVGILVHHKEGRQASPLNSHGKALFGEPIRDTLLMSYVMMLHTLIARGARPDVKGRDAQGILG